MPPEVNFISRLPKESLPLGRHSRPYRGARIESRRASMEDFKKDQERFSQALQQQKRSSIMEQWSRFLKGKAKVSINQDLI